MDHYDSLDANLTKDDVVNFPITHLPPVFSPTKTRNNEPESSEAAHVHQRMVDMKMKMQNM